MWPELAQMALDYLTIPGYCPCWIVLLEVFTDIIFPSLATSVDVERAFSFGRLTISLYRHSLRSETIRVSIVFGDRCKQGLVIDDELVEWVREKGSRGGRPRREEPDEDSHEGEEASTSLGDGEVIDNGWSYLE